MKPWLALALLCLQGCMNLTVEDWNVRYQNCEIDAVQSRAKVTCEWEHSWLGT
jgi:hypothetical protein